nr:uncharacterized protein LOC111516381 [Leptinotarsa decemlineata]
MLNWIFSVGILCGKCGKQGISLRTSLTFNQNHAGIFLDKLEEVIKETELYKPPPKKTEKAVEFSATKPAKSNEIPKEKRSICDSIKKHSKTAEEKPSICDSVKDRLAKKPSGEKSSICDSKKAEKKTEQPERMAHIDEVKPYGDTGKKSDCDKKKTQHDKTKESTFKKKIMKISLCPRPWARKKNDKK